MAQEILNQDSLIQIGFFFSIFMLRTNLEWQQVANLHVSVKASDAAEEYNPANLNGLSLFINPWFLCEVNEAVI